MEAALCGGRIWTMNKKGLTYADVVFDCYPCAGGPSEAISCVKHDFEEMLIFRRFIFIVLPLVLKCRPRDIVMDKMFLRTF